MGIFKTETNLSYYLDLNEWPAESQLCERADKSSLLNVDSLGKIKCNPDQRNERAVVVCARVNNQFVHITKLMKILSLKNLKEQKDKERNQIMLCYLWNNSVSLQSI